MDLFIDQNNSNNLKLLASQRYLYSKAKTLRRFRIFFSIGLALASPFLLKYLPNSKDALAVMGGVWVLLSRLLLEGIEIKCIKNAANIQEQFDTGLFNLPWNKTLVGHKVTLELVHSYARSFKWNIDMLKDWYPNTKGIPYPMNVLICQRCNIVWDWRLRYKYAYFTGGVTIALLIAGIVFASLTKQPVFDYVLGLLIPSLSALLLGYDVTKLNYILAKEKQDKEKEISAVWESGLIDPSSVTTDACRRVQDCIYLFRIKNALVPDWWYNLFRNKFQFDMESVIKELNEGM